MGSFYKYAQLPKDNRPQVAFAGRSNVGTSSLLNKLTGRKKLAKVSNTPGKTRSLNLPGYGYAKVSKTEKAEWAKLIGEYLERSENLIGLIVLLDCRREPNDDDLRLIQWLDRKELPGIAIVTKADKLGKDKLKQKVQQVETDFGLPAIPFSILTGQGKKEIQTAVLSLIDEHNKLN